MIGASPGAASPVVGLLEALTEARRLLVGLDDEGDWYCTGCDQWEDNCCEPDASGVRIEHDKDCAVPVIDRAMAAFSERKPLRESAELRLCMYNHAGIASDSEREAAERSLDKLEAALLGPPGGTGR